MTTYLYTKDAEKRICLHCNKTLKTIGNTRKGGVYNCRYFDWSTRQYHKKCYKEIKLNEKYNIN